MTSKFLFCPRVRNLINVRLENTLALPALSFRVTSVRQTAQCCDLSLVTEAVLLMAAYSLTSNNTE